MLMRCLQQKNSFYKNVSIKCTRKIDVRLNFLLSSSKMSYARNYFQRQRIYTIQYTLNCNIGLIKRIIL